MAHKQQKSGLIGFSSSGQQINKILQSRLNAIDEVIGNQNSRVQRLQVSQSYMQQIAQHCSQYAPIRRQVQQMMTNEQFFKTMGEKSAQFWSINQRIQKQLQKRLNSLKQIDKKIDQMIDQQIAMANQIEDTQQIIRSILNRKQPDHITKAQPLYTKKQSYISKLQQMKREKQIIKEQKLQQLTKILEILKQMKTIRINRLQQCKYTTSNKDSVTLLECLAKDLQQVVENKQLQEQNVISENKILAVLEQSNHKVDIYFIKKQIIRLSKQLAETFQLQQKCMLQLGQLRENKSEIQCFNSRFVGYFDIPEQTILSVSQKFTKFIENQSQKLLELKQVTQGINTTEDTIEIFQNLKYNLQTQTIRKNQLIQKINNLTKMYSSQRQNREIISAKEVKIQSAKISHGKLLSQLEQAAQQADVKKYKFIHAQIDQIAEQINTEINDLSKLKAQKRESSKKIFTQTNLIQQEFRDLISEILPQIWLRDHDFNKEETIADFEVYLTKLFSRLKILA